MVFPHSKVGALEWQEIPTRNVNVRVTLPVLHSYTSPRKKKATWAAGAREVDPPDGTSIAKGKAGAKEPKLLPGGTDQVQSRKMEDGTAPQDSVVLASVVGKSKRGEALVNALPKTT